MAVDIETVEVTVVEVGGLSSPVEVAHVAAGVQVYESVETGTVFVETILQGGSVEVEVGIPGPAGVNEADMTYAKRVDFEGNTIYRGEAPVGASGSDNVWRIRRIELAEDGDVTEVWANGTAEFVHAWTDRISLSYS